MRKKSTKVLFFLLVLGFIVSVMLLICSPRSALASTDQLGSEGDVLINNLPYDLLIHIPIIQTRLISIRQNYLTIWPSNIISMLDTVDLRLSFIAQNPVPNPLISPETATQAIGILDRITSVLINPQPLPPALPPDMTVHLVTVMDRISAILINPQPEPPAPELIAQGFNVLDRVSWILINPQPEPPAPELIAQGFNVLDRVSWILINPQPEPPAPELIAQGFNVLDRVSWILINPQPEPPAPSSDITVQTLEIIYRVSGVILIIQTGELQGSKIPAFNALDHLSINLLDAILKKSFQKVSAQINAMDHITRLYPVP
jgi:hypothetical protein